MVKMGLPAKIGLEYLKAVANKRTRFPQTINNFDWEVYTNSKRSDNFERHEENCTYPVHAPGIFYQLWTKPPLYLTKRS